MRDFFHAGLTLNAINTNEHDIVKEQRREPPRGLNRHCRTLSISGQTQCQDRLLQVFLVGHFESRSVRSCGRRMARFPKLVDIRTTALTEREDQHDTKWLQHDLRSSFGRGILSYFEPRRVHRIGFSVIEELCRKDLEKIVMVPFFRSPLDRSQDLAGRDH